MRSSGFQVVLPPAVGILVAVILAAGFATASPGYGDSDVFSLNTRAVAAVDPDLNSVARFSVGPCEPNPFNPQTVIPFAVAGRGPVRLAVYDVRGRVVRVLVDEVGMVAGMHRATWDGRDDRGHDVASGIYVAHLQNDGQSLRTTMVLVR